MRRKVLKGILVSATASVLTIVLINNLDCSFPKQRSR